MIEISQIKLVAPPLYVMYLTCLDKEYGIQLLEKGIQLIKEKITSLGGELVVKVPVLIPFFLFSLFVLVLFPPSLQLAAVRLTTRSSSPLLVLILILTHTCSYQPRSVTEYDDKQLTDMMEEMERLNREVRGDDETSDTETPTTDSHD
jgi:uncharacterized membrane protein YhaH (DUF805 family)